MSKFDIETKWKLRVLKWTLLKLRVVKWELDIVQGTNMTITLFKSIDLFKVLYFNSLIALLMWSLMVAPFLLYLCKIRCCFGGTTSEFSWFMELLPFPFLPYFRSYIRLLHGCSIPLSCPWWSLAVANRRSVGTTNLIGTVTFFYGS